MGCSAHSHICEEKGCGELSQKRRVEGTHFPLRSERRSPETRSKQNKPRAPPHGPARRPPGAPGGQRESPLPCDLNWLNSEIHDRRSKKMGAPLPGHVVLWASASQAAQGLPRAPRVPSRSSPGRGCAGGPNGPGVGAKGLSERAGRGRGCPRSHGARETGALRAERLPSPNKHPWGNLVTPV